MPRNRALPRLYALLALLALLSAPLPGFSQEQDGSVQEIALTVYFPPDLTLVEKYDLPVEGIMISGGIDDFEVVVNDGRPTRVRVRDRCFADEVGLDEGLNTVRIGPVVRRVWLATAKSKPPPEYQRAYGHFGLNDGCLECHKTDDDGNFKLAGEREEICGWCHGDLIWGSARAPWVSVHAPVRNGRCLLCHTPHTSVKPGLPAPAPPTCASCHQPVLERLKTDRFTHGPMNIGDCRICHTVHSSAELKLLKRPATALCTDCHSEILAGINESGPLKPHTLIPEGKCGRCHEPHSSVNQRLLRQPAGRLCQECHEGKTRSFHESKGFSIYICAKCHEMHRPAQPHLIVDASRSLCTGCHDFGGESTFTHSFAAEGKCFHCHSFHDVALSSDIAPLCMGCHRENPRLAKAHRKIPFEKSRCTNCHLPHKSKQKQLLRAYDHTPFKKRKCELCHSDRADQIGPVYLSLCTGCHRTKTAAAAAGALTVHPPFKEKDCSSCHRSHNADAPNLLREAEGDMCLNCHRKMRKSMLMTPVSSHADVLQGRCGSCHDPHWSENPTLLRKPQTELCPACHLALVRAPGGAPWPFTHKPIEEGKCRLCHRSHIASNPKLLKLPTPLACRPCHVQFFAGSEAKEMISRHEPFKKGACAACHDQHGGERVKLLKAGVNDELCRGCHARLKKNAHHTGTAADPRTGGTGAAAGSSGCLYCHRPHVSSERQLLIPSTGPICQACHKTAQ